MRLGTSRYPATNSWVHSFGVRSSLRSATARATACLALLLACTLIATPDRISPMPMARTRLVEFITTTTQCDYSCFRLIAEFQRHGAGGTIDADRHMLPRSVVRGHMDRANRTRAGGHTHSPPCSTVS